MTTLTLPTNAIKLSNEIEIWKIPNFATSSECDELINDAKNVGYQQSEVDSKKNSKTKSRTSSTSFIPNNKTKIGKILGEKAKNIINSKLSKNMKNSLEGIQVQKYAIGQKYNPHYDTFEHKDGSDQRSWTLMIYLNDVEEGGGTLFTNLNLRIKPEKGTAILWNNLDSDMCRNNKTLHMGEPVIKGEKYITTYWFRKPDNSNTLCPQSSDIKFNMNYKAEQSKSEADVSKLTYSILEYFEKEEVKICGCIFIGFVILCIIILIWVNFKS